MLTPQEAESGSFPLAIFAQDKALTVPDLSVRRKSCCILLALQHTHLVPLNVKLPKSVSTVSSLLIHFNLSPSLLPS